MTPAQELSERLRRLAGYANDERRWADKCAMIEAAEMITRSPMRIEAENERMRRAVRYFIGCSYPVSTEINPRGHAWRGEESLDFALGEALAAVGREGK